MHLRRTSAGRGCCVLLTLATIAACVPADTETSALPPVDSLRYVIYYNSAEVPLAEIANTHYTHVILSFLKAVVAANGSIEIITPAKMDGQWDSIALVRDAGMRVMISFGGGLVKAAQYAPLVGREKELAAAIAQFVRVNDLDGVDIDFEASSMMHLDLAEGVEDGRAFLIALARELRAELPAPRYEMSHAPQPPYLNHEWHGGPYLDVLEAAGDAIDWISIQYYNNPGYDAPIADKIVGADHRSWPTSYRALVHPDGHLGWASNRIVVGKPVDSRDTGNGAIPAGEIRREIVEPLCAAFGNDFGGLVGWQFSGSSADHRYWNEEMAKALTAEACRKTDVQ